MPPVSLGLTMVPTYVGPGGATAANVLSFISLGGDFDQDSMDNILALWRDYWKQLACDSWFINSTAVCSHLTTDPPDVIIASADGDSGDGSSDPLPAQVAFVVSLRAGAGRRRRGRIYIPGLGEGDVDDTSRVGGSFVDLAISAFLEFATGVGGGYGWAPAVYSRADSAVHIVSSVGADTVIDTQRRRVERLA